MIVFDLYGTLVRIGVKRHPYRRILTWAREQGRRPHPDDARMLMTLNEEPEEIFANLGIRPPAELMRQFRLDVADELDSVSLFDDVVPTLTRVQDSGVKLAVCSNLARPYGVVVDRLLSRFDLLRCLSYEVGAIKPERSIYDWIVRHSGYGAEETTFVGDNYFADYEAPSQFGFQALHLVRGVQSSDYTIGSLVDIPLRFIEQ